jgi:regulatory protein
VRRAALDLLARREFCAAELRERLLKKLGAGSPVDACLEQLTAEGLLDDSRFVESFVHAHRRKGHGPLRILQELSRRGVSDGLAEACVDARDPGWIDLARHWRERRFGAPIPRAASEWQRQARHLQSRGFSTEQVRRALRDPDE